MHTGEKIRKLRKSKNVSQVQLASKLLVSRQTISNWENDKTRPELENLVLLCQYFGISVESFLEDDLSKIKIKHKEFLFAKNIVVVIFASFIVLVLSILFSVTYNRSLLVVPFLLLDGLLFCILLFSFRNKSEESLLKPVSKKIILFIMVIAGVISFFSIYFLLSLF